MRVMYDTVTVDEIPNDPGAVAGYVGGSWPTYTELERRYPHAARLSIAINSGEDADCLDCEPGDENPLAYAQIAEWVRRQHARGVYRPCVYASESNVLGIIEGLRREGIERPRYRVWSAHYTGRPHICATASCGAAFEADATQWTDRALGRNLDESLVQDSFFAGPAVRPVQHQEHEHHVRAPRRRRPTPKVTASTAAAAVLAGVTELVHHAGVPFTPAEAGAISALGALIAGYLTREPLKAG